MAVVYQHKDSATKHYGDHAFLEHMDNLLDSDADVEQARKALDELIAYLQGIEILPAEGEDTDRVATAHYKVAQDIVDDVKEKARKNEEATKDEDVSDEELVKRQNEDAKRETAKRQREDLHEADKANRDREGLEEAKEPAGKGRNKAKD